MGRLLSGDVEHFVLVASEVLEVRRVYVGEPTGRIDSPDQGRRGFGQRAEPGLAASQRRVGLLELGDVDCDTADQDAAVARRQGELADDRVVNRAVTVLERLQRLDATAFLENTAIVRGELGRCCGREEVLVRTSEQLVERRNRFGI